MHRIALVVPCLAAGLHLVMLAKEWQGAAEPPWDMRYAGLVVGLWALVIWKVWRRSWGRGLGVVMMVLGAWFFHLCWNGWGMCRGPGEEIGFLEALKYLPVEAAVVVAGFFCMLLPRAAPPDERDDAVVASGGGL